MPKSKKRKGRYTPKPRVQQQETMTATVPAGEAVAPAAPRPSTPAAKMATAAARSSPPGSRVPVMPQVNVSTELKVIGIVTVALFALIVALYFVLR